MDPIVPGVTGFNQGNVVASQPNNNPPLPSPPTQIVNPNGTFYDPTAAAAQSAVNLAASNNGGVAPVTPISTSGISSSSQSPIYSQIVSSLNSMQTSQNDLVNKQNAVLSQQESAAQGDAAARIAAQDAAFAQQLKTTEQNRTESLNNADTQEAQVNPYGFIGSTAYSGMKGEINKQFDDTVSQIKSAQIQADQAAAAGQADIAAQYAGQGLTIAQNALQNNMSMMQNLFGIMEQSQNYDLAVKGYNAQVGAQGQQMAANQLNTVLPTLTGKWDTMSATDQASLLNMATMAGYNPDVIKSVMQQKNGTVTQWQSGNQLWVGLIDDTGNVTNKHILGPAPTRAAGTGSVLTLSEAKTSGLPLSLVGMSQEQVAADLQSETAPAWFKQHLEQSSKSSITPESINSQWKEFQSKVVGDSGNLIPPAKPTATVSDTLKATQSSLQQYKDSGYSRAEVEAEWKAANGETATKHITIPTPIKNLLDQIYQ